MLEEKFNEFEKSAEDLDNYMEPWEIFNDKDAMDWLDANKRIIVKCDKAGIKSLFQNNEFKKLIETEEILKKLLRLNKKFKVRASQCSTSLAQLATSKQLEMGGSGKESLNNYLYDEITSIEDIKLLAEESKDNSIKLFKEIWGEKEGEDMFRSEENQKSARENIILYFKLNRLVYEICDLRR